MPVIKSSYQPPWFYQADLSTIVRGALLPVRALAYRREVLETPDGDFMDIDWLGEERSPTVLLVHGFEGNSKSRSIVRLAAHLQTHGFQIAALNLKGCSGRSNRLLGSYHSGAFHLIEWAINFIQQKQGHLLSPLYAVGVSLGGNILLNYLSRDESKHAVKRAVALSVPCDLKGSEQAIWERLFHLYTRGFLTSLKQKAEEKNERFADKIDIQKVRAARRIREFDDCFTAPVHGFDGVEDYYFRASSKSKLHAIRVPTLLLTAQDDPFLSASCLPFAEAEISEQLFFEAPKRGGHLAFPSHDSWLEKRVVEFLTKGA